MEILYQRLEGREHLANLENPAAPEALEALDLLEDQEA